MALSIGIIGLPNVGKSTLFNALTDANALIANYPFATIEPNTGIVPIPDPRLQKLAEIYKTDKIVPATVTFVDIAGLVAGASQGEGLGNQFLAHIRSCAAICHVVRVFKDENVARAGSSDPKCDIEIVNTELVLADLQTVSNRLPKLQKEAKANPKLKASVEMLEKIKQTLEDDKPLFASSELSADSFLLEQLQLLTAKPVIYVFNVDEKTLADETKKKELAKIVGATHRDAMQGAGEQRTEPYIQYGEGAAQTATPQSALSSSGVGGSATKQAGAVRSPKAVFVCAKLENELRGLDEADCQELLESYGQKESGLIQLIHAAYDVLGLQSFLTAGEKSSSAKASEGRGEVRAWTIRKDATAPEAAGVIHTDFEHGFIAAQVINYQDLMATGSEAAARAAGKVRTEGKDYLMQPDDVVEFRFNV